MTLRARLTALYGGLSLAALLLVGGATVAVVEYDLRQDALERAQMGLAPEGLDTSQRRLLALLGAVLPLTLLGVGVGGWLIAGRALAPLRRITDVTRAVSADDLERRVPRPARAGDEVDALASSLNGLLDRLERSLTDVRRFTADAAHELRTPLAAVMGRLEVALRHPRGQADLVDTMGLALEELGRLSRLVDGLLTLTRTDGGALAADGAPIEIGALARAVVERDAAAAEDRRMTLVLASTVSPPSATHVRGDGPLLERALGNLVANAILHGREGGRIELALTRVEGRAQLCVSDDGPGVGEAERAHLFERFFRGDVARTRGGFGLGLSIARAIAERHGGTVRYAPAATGPGSVFTLELPLVEVSALTVP